jgi:peroxiredoxin family protein/TusA-related sulfurtransferase
VNIPLDELRERLDEVPQDKLVLTHCGVGLRAYVASRILREEGIEAKFITGGQRSWRALHRPEANAAKAAAGKEEEGAGLAEAPKGAGPVEKELDLRGLQCPGPVLRLSQEAQEAKAGTKLKVVASDPGFPAEVRSWCHHTGHRLVSVGPEGGGYGAVIEVSAGKSAAVAGEASLPTKKTMVVFSGDLDRVLAAFMIANGAASMGDEVTMFFTFWGMNALKRERPGRMKKGLTDRMFGWMMPRGPGRLKLSKMNFGGAGTAMMKAVMKQRNMESLPSLLAKAQESGVRMVACTVSMNVMGIRAEELIDGIEFGGVATFLDSAGESGVTLFI